MYPFRIGHATNFYDTSRFYTECMTPLTILQKLSKCTANNASMSHVII